MPCKTSLFAVTLSTLISALLRKLYIRFPVRRSQVIFAGSLLLLYSLIIPSSLDSSVLFEIPRVDIQPPKGPMLALTFDDGPHAGKTEALLRVLRQADVPATFFVVGKMADRYPQLVQDIAGDGHEIADHTYTHPTLTTLSNDEVLSELQQTRDAVRRLTGQDSHLFRPPGGDFSRRVVKLTSDAGYKMVLWSVLVPDLRGASQAAMRRRIMTRVADGGIILMHSGVQKTIDMLPGVIAELKQRGYRFVTVSELLQKNRSAPAAPNLPPLQTVSGKKY